MSIARLMQMAAAGAGGINPREYFNTVLWTGTGGARTISGLGFQPDWVWAKGRSGSATYPHLVWDVLRGTNLNLIPNTTDAEFNVATSSSNGGLGTSASDGFTIVAGTSSADNLNASSPASTYVGWAWKANGAGVSNTDGTITSTVSANTTAGISIVTFTDAGSACTVGHGLGVAPAMIIAKFRGTGGNWSIYHQSLGNTYRLRFTTEAQLGPSAGWWNNTSPTSTVFSLGTDLVANTTQVAYCFAEVEGFSKFGSYTGNGSATGPSVTTDFQPTWLMIKRTDTTGDWIILDSARDTANPRDKFLEPNSADAEATGNDVDFNATGFQLKSTSASINASGGTYIYACFA